MADPKEMEIELGYFNLERDRGKNTFIIPKVVLNYGVIRNLEVVSEFGIAEPPHGSVRLEEPALSLKAVLREGVLQEKPGVSFAVEAGPLLPSGREKQKVGFEGVGIISGELSPAMLHLNLSGGVDRMENNPFVIWGLIAELPVAPKFRVVGEIDGENSKGRSADTSVLIGFIWNPPLHNVAIDAGIRRGISGAAPNWMFTTGLTFGF